MKIANGWSNETNPSDAVQEAVHMMQKDLGENIPQLVAIFTTGNMYDKDEVFKSLKTNLKPETKIWGMNSEAAGVISPTGTYRGLSVMGFYSPDLVVGIAAVPFNFNDPTSFKDVGRKAISTALEDAGETASNPPKIILFAGLSLINDTDIYHGMQDVIGQIPIWGGNACYYDDKIIPGEGHVFSTNGSATNTVCVAALWTKSKVGMAYGFSFNEIPKYSGIVTKADVDKRIVYEIDHKPAADVYNEWLGGKLTDLINAGGGQISLDIVGRFAFKKPITKESIDYVVVAALNIFPDKSMFITHEAIPEGTEITLVEVGDQSQFTNIASIAGMVARNRGNISKDNIAGAMVGYCDALFFAARIAGLEVTPTFTMFDSTIGGAPFMGLYMGGEIGFSPNFGDEGNRMLAYSNVVVVFGKD